MASNLHYDKSIFPETTNTYDLGSTGLFWRHVRTTDLTVNSVTPGQVFYAGTDGILLGDSGLTYDGGGNLSVGSNLTVAGRIYSGDAVDNIGLIRNGPGQLGIFPTNSSVIGIGAVLDLSSLTTSDKTFTFPNNSGTFALTSDLHSAVTVLDSSTVDFTLTGQQITASVIVAGLSGIDHGSQLTGLGDDDHTQYALLLGRSGGQTLIGGTGSGDNLTLKSSSNATKGKIVLGTLSAYDEVNDRLGIGTTSPGFALHIVGNESRFDNSASAGASHTMSIKAGASGTSALYLSDTGSGTVAGLVYTHSTDLLTIRSVAGDRLVLSASVLYPSTSDGIALGSGTNMYSDLFLASGAVINFNNGDITITHSTDALTFAGAANFFQFSSGIVPTANDGAALGTTGNSWSDLFLASGGVINFSAGDVTITHATDTLTFAGAASGYIFNNGNVGIGATPDAKLYVFSSTAGAITTDTNAVLVIEKGSGGHIQFKGSAGLQGLIFGTAATANNDGRFWYSHTSREFQWFTGGTQRLTLTSSALTPFANDGIALGTATTAYADLFLASGGVINFNNGNVTLTHSAGALTLGGSGATTLALGTNSITMTGSLAATGARVTKGWFTDIESTNMPTVGGVSLSTTFVDVAGDTMTGQLIISRAGSGLDVVNTTDNASVQVAILEGDRATMAANDEAYVSFKLSDSAGNQDEFARLTWKGTTVTSTSEVGRLNWSLMSAGSLVNTLQLTTTALSPTTNDLVSLGTSSLMFSDGFFADGAVINFNNGNATLTHSAGLLTSNVTMQIPTVRGSSSASGNLQLTPTSNATKGKILLGSNSAYDDANNRLGIGSSSPLYTLHVSSAASVIALFQSAAATDGAYMGSPGYYEADEIGFFDAATDNPIFVSATGSGTLYYGPLGGMIITASGTVGMGMAGITTPTRQLDVYGADAGTNNSLKVLRLIHETSGTPAANIGVGMEYVVETSASNNEIGVTTDAIATTVTAGSEVFDYRIATMSGGATAVTRVWINNTGLGYGITPSAPIHAYQATLGNEVQRLESTATNDDPRESVYQNRVTTTDGTITTLHTFTIPSSTTYTVEANVIARRTGGVSGSAEDGAYYKIIATFKNVAGTATQIGTTTVVATHESQAGWDCVFDVTGATARVRVTGAASNNVTWHMTAHMWQVSS